MYGAILGDLAGSIYEYQQYQKVSSIDVKELITNDSFYSDDTILTIALLDAILNNRNYDMYLRKYIREYKDYRPQYKPYFETTFSPNTEKWGLGNGQGNSLGNGAMMRISPVGFMFNNEEEIIENARLATIPSHNMDSSIDCATTIALIIFYLRKGLSKKEIIDKLNLEIKYIPLDKFNYTCTETISNCIYAFFTSNNFEDAIIKAIRMGGDTDTNAAIVGSMAEACYGISNELKQKVREKIPDKFMDLLDKAYDIINN